jgi:hypothetical protein
LRSRAAACISARPQEPERPNPDIDATARQLDPDDGAAARRALKQRYGIQLRLVDLVLRLRREHLIFFEVAPS